MPSPAAVVAVSGVPRSSQEEVMEATYVFSYSASRSARAGARHVFGLAATAAAQGVSVSGRLYHSVSSKPIAGAIVAIEGTALEVKSGPDGSYSIPDVPAGAHHLLVIAKGFVPARSELTVAADRGQPRRRRRSRAALQRGRVGQSGCAEPVRFLSADDRARRRRTWRSSWRARSARRSRPSRASPSGRSGPVRRARSSAVSTAIAC